MVSAATTAISGDCGSIPGDRCEVDISSDKDRHEIYNETLNPFPKAERRSRQQRFGRLSWTGIRQNRSHNIFGCSVCYSWAEIIKHSRSVNRHETINLGQL